MRLGNVTMLRFVRRGWLCWLKKRVSERSTSIDKIGSSECAICGWTLEHYRYGIKSSAIASPQLGPEGLLKIISGRLQQISLTAIFAAGLPVVVSRTWQVIGSLAGAAIIDCRQLEMVDGGIL